MTKFVIFMLLFAFDASSLTIDFMPIKEGNVWVYGESFGQTSSSVDYQFTRTVKISKVWNLHDTVAFSLAIHDSGYFNYPIPVTDTFYSDTLEKTKDAIVLLNTPTFTSIEAMKLLFLFPFSFRDTATTIRNSCDTSPMICSNHSDIFGGKNDSIMLFHVSADIIVPSSAWAIDTIIAFGNIGVLNRHFESFNRVISQSNSCRLISFNGTPAPAIPSGVINKNKVNDDHLSDKRSSTLKKLYIDHRRKTDNAFAGKQNDLLGRELNPQVKSPASNLYFEKPLVPEK